MTRDTTVEPARRLIRAGRLFTGSVMLDGSRLLVEGERVVAADQGLVAAGVRV